MPADQGAIEIMGWGPHVTLSVSVDERSYRGVTGFGASITVAPGRHTVSVQAQSGGSGFARPGMRLEVPMFATDALVVEVPAGQLVRIGVDVPGGNRRATLYAERPRPIERGTDPLTAPVEAIDTLARPVWSASYPPPTGQPVPNIIQRATKGTLGELDEFEDGRDADDAPEGSGWFPDPTGRHQHRWWDGQAWSVFVEDDHHNDVDPV